MEDSEAGFTLLEVLIAMVIMGIGFSILVQGFMQINEGIEKNNDYTYVSSWAESKMNQIVRRIDLNNHGRFSHQNKRYSWWIEERTINQNLKKVVLTIEWQQDSKKLHYSLSRLVIDSN